MSLKNIKLVVFTEVAATGKDVAATLRRLNPGMTVQLRDPFALKGDLRNHEGHFTHICILSEDPAAIEAVEAVYDTEQVHTRFPNQIGVGFEDLPEHGIAIRDGEPAAALPGDPKSENMVTRDVGNAVIRTADTDKPKGKKKSK